MILDLLNNVDNIDEFINKYPKDVVIAVASVRGMPISILKAFENPDINHILPVIFLKGIEYNGTSNEDYYKHWQMMKNRVKELYGDSKVLYEPVIYKNIELWRLFNVRYARIIENKYGRCNTCLTCKAYFTIVHYHIALMFNKSIIIPEKPNKNKTKFVHELFEKLTISNNNLAKNLDINVLTPINWKTKMDDVKYLLGSNWYWLEDESSCLFERNWEPVIDLKHNKSDIKAAVSSAVIEKYIEPLSLILINKLNKDFKLSKDEINNIIFNYIKNEGDNHGR